MNGGEKIYVEGNLKKGPLRNLGVDWRIILKLI
jgi:hypothetical protein